jgi:hypothetical protein
VGEPAGGGASDEAEEDGLSDEPDDLSVGSFAADGADCFGDDCDDYAFDDAY